MAEGIEQPISLRLVAVGMGGQPTVVFVDPDRDRETLLHASGEADVIEVTMSEQKSRDVGHAAPDGSEAVPHGAPGGG